MLINYSELQVFVCWSCLRSAHYANAPKFTSCFFVLPYLFQSLGMFNCSLLHANLYTNIPFGNYFPNQSCLATIGELTDIKRQFRSSITALDFFSQSRRSNYYWKNYSDGFRFPTQSSYSWPNLGLEWSICSKSRVASSCLPRMMNIHSSIRKYVFSSPQQIYSQLKKLIPGVGK